MLRRVDVLRDFRSCRIIVTVRSGGLPFAGQTLLNGRFQTRSCAHQSEETVMPFELDDVLLALLIVEV